MLRGKGAVLEVHSFLLGDLLVKEFVVACMAGTEHFIGDQHDAEGSDHVGVEVEQQDDLEEVGGHAGEGRGVRDAEAEGQASEGNPCVLPAVPAFPELNVEETAKVLKEQLVEGSAEAPSEETKVEELPTAPHTEGSVVAAGFETAMVLKGHAGDARDAEAEEQESEGNPFVLPAVPAFPKLVELPTAPHAKGSVEGKSIEKNALVLKDLLVEGSAEAPCDEETAMVPMEQLVEGSAEVPCEERKLARRSWEATVAANQAAHARADAAVAKRDGVAAISALGGCSEVPSAAAQEAQGLDEATVALLESLDKQGKIVFAAMGLGGHDWDQVSAAMRRAAADADSCAPCMAIAKEFLATAPSEG